MNKGNQNMQAPMGGKSLQKTSAVLAGALASILGISASYAAHHGGDYPALEIATQKTTISSKAEAGAGTKLRLWFEDESGNMTTADHSYNIVVSSSDTAVVNTFSLDMAAGSMSTTLTIGGVAGDGSVAGNGSTTLLANATATDRTLKSNSVPLSVVDSYLTASFTNLSNGTNIGKFVNVTLKDNAGAFVTTDATVTHVTGGIGSIPAEVVPAGLIGNTNGDLMFSFEDPTGNVSTTGAEYYVVSSIGMGDAVIDSDGDTTADIVIPTMPSLTGQTTVTGGVSKQDGIFAPLFPNSSVQSTVSESDALNINIAMMPNPNHVGEVVDKVIVAAYMDIYGLFGLDPSTIMAWYIDADRLAFTPWDWQNEPGALKPYQTGKMLMGETEAFHIYSGPLTGAAGFYVFFAGYQLADGTNVFNSAQMASMVVEPAQ